MRRVFWAFCRNFQAQISAFLKNLIACADKTFISNNACLNLRFSCGFSRNRVSSYVSELKYCKVTRSPPPSSCYTGIQTNTTACVDKRTIRPTRPGEELIRCGVRGWVVTMSTNSDPDPSLHHLSDTTTISVLSGLSLILYTSLIVLVSYRYRTGKRGGSLHPK